MTTPNQPQPVASGSNAGMAAEPYFDTTSHKWMVETPDGNELEWDANRHAWVPVVDEDLLKKQQAAYSVSGVDETEEVQPLTKEERKAQHKKRKLAPTANAESKNTAVFVSNLPTVPGPPSIKLLSDVFSKAGLILVDPATNAPRIKLYKHADSDAFKGEALVVYLQRESVELAVRLFDQTELELGSGKGLIRVQEAKWDSADASQQHKDKRKKGDPTTTTATKDARQGGGAKDDKSRKLGKKAAALRQKLQDWDSSDDEASEATSKKLRGVVVLEGMFTLQELDEDATLLLDLKEDVREECETLGTVTNVTLYDKEEAGIMTVRFKEELSAQACIAKMSGRFFAGRTIQAYPMTSKHKFVKSGRGGDDQLEGTGFEATDEAGSDASAAADKEKERLKAYAEWLEKGGQ
ncbi:hypothetical protein JCM11491_003002 [Sporobolomyces phaffii]